MVRATQHLSKFSYLRVDPLLLLLVAFQSSDKNLSLEFS
jgi:hypothetical protein